MKAHYIRFHGSSLLVASLGMPEAALTQQGGLTMHRWAVFTAEGVKDLKTRTVVALKGNIAKFRKRRVQE